MSNSNPFTSFLTQLANNPQQIHSLLLAGQQKNLSGIAKYWSDGYGFEYLKLQFSDHSALVVVPSLQEIGFSEKGNMGAGEGIPNSIVGAPTVQYDHRAWNLANGPDYQRVIEVLAGKPGHDSEGECAFWDYTCNQFEGAVLSLAYMSETRQRADVLTKPIPVEEIEIQ